MPAGLIASLLIANRGEIACRIIRTARRMGIRTVAVYSDADAKALHVRQADEAVHIGPVPARESYLVGEKIIAAAKATGAEAIHPGYGFLSENADFAQAVIDAGLIWVGPKPASIRAMGLKDAAKKLMDEAGVPTTPGYLGEDQDPARLQAEADKIGYPVLIKAVAGGGGKGMRRVEASAEFAEMLLSCKREAASSFGDDRVLIEKYILRPRHIEVQVFGDTPRQCRPPVRARLLAPAPPPEGDRGSAGARHGRGDARGDLRGGGEGGQGGRLCRRRHDRVHRRRERRPAGRPHLVHGNEHAAPGRASGDRGDYRAGSGRVAIAGGVGRDAAEAAGRTRRSMAGRWRHGFMPRIPANGFLPSRSGRRSNAFRLVPTCRTSGPAPDRHGRRAGRHDLALITTR